MYERRFINKVGLVLTVRDGARACARVPDGSMEDLVEQVVMQVCGCRKTQELHSERRDEA